MPCCRKYFKPMLYLTIKSVSFREGVNAILKKVGLYLQNDSYLISSSSYTFKHASKLKLI